MSTEFPAALDVLTNPSGTDALDSVAVPHAAQHANANDAIEALQAKVGADGSAVATSLDYKVSALQSSVDLKAPLASPSFTGNVSSTGSILSVGGGLGYGAGAGGTVTQATSKSTAVTLNKPCGQITMNAAPLADGARVGFLLNNSLIAAQDILAVSVTNAFGASYRVKAACATGVAAIYLINESGAGSLAESVVITFELLKGATA